MSEQEMEFADPDWQPTQAKYTQQDDTAVYVPQPIHGKTYNMSHGYDNSLYEEGYRGPLLQQQTPYAPPFAQQVPPRPTRRMRGRSRWWIWVIILIIVFSVIGGGTRSYDRSSSVADKFPGRPGPVQQQTYNVGLGNASMVHISDYSGSIILQVGDTNSNQVEVQTDAAYSDPPQIEVGGGSIMITMNPSQGNSDVVVMLPPQLTVSMDTSAGNIEVDGYTGQIDTIPSFV
jgi:hypothetical protein